MLRKLCALAMKEAASVNVVKVRGCVLKSLAVITVVLTVSKLSA